MKPIFTMSPDQVICDARANIELDKIKELKMIYSEIESRYAAAGEVSSILMAYNDLTDDVMNALSAKYDAKFECLRRDCENVQCNDVRNEHRKCRSAKATLEQDAD